jgi:Cysteine-rich CPXCG
VVGGRKVVAQGFSPARHRTVHMEISVDCPYCGEPLELYVDPSGGSTQKYVEDCAVCCQPMEVLVEVEGDDEASVSVRRFDD